MDNLIIKVVDFNKNYSELKNIRNTVFIIEQKVPEALEWDIDDKEATHIIAYYSNIAVGTARLLKDGHIGRMAVLKKYRNRKIGGAMLKYIIKVAQDNSAATIELSAQEHAIEFYKKFGFIVTSGVYMDAGIPHFNMKYKI